VAACSAWWSEQLMPRIQQGDSLGCHGFHPTSAAPKVLAEAPVGHCARPGLVEKSYQILPGGSQSPLRFEGLVELVPYYRAVLLRYGRSAHGTMHNDRRIAWGPSSRWRGGGQGNGPPLWHTTRPI